MFHSLCLVVKNLRICNLRTAHLRICDCSSIKRNLRIWNFWTHISKKFADLKNICTPHLCKFATVVNHTGSKFAASVNDTGVILPLISTTPAVNLPPATTAPAVHLELWIFPQIFEKIQNAPKWDTIFRSLGETIHEKTWNWKSHGTVPLNFTSHVQIEQQNWKPQILSVIPIQLKAIFHDCEST